MNIVLFTSGLNPTSRLFHTLPGKAVGIIEIHSGESEPALIKLIRKLRNLLSLKKFTNLQEYCEVQGFRFDSIYKRDSDRIRNTLADWQCDLVITSHCPVIPMKALENLPHGAINLHPSALPAYRGGKPLLWQVFDQVKDIGVTVHYLNAKADTGPIIEQRLLPRPSAASEAQLDQITEGEMGIQLLSNAINKIQHGKVKSTTQSADSPTRYAKNVNIEEFCHRIQNSPASLSVIWDLAHFVGYWPLEFEHSHSWRNWFRWVPASYSPNKLINPGPEKPCIKINGFRIWLVNAEGKIQLRPQFSARLLFLRLQSLLSPMTT